MTLEEKIRLGLLAVTIGTPIVAATLGVSLSLLDVVGGHGW